MPLKYIVGANKPPDPTPNVNFFDDYIMNAPLAGQAFTIDAVEVHTYIVNFITQKDEAESIIKIFWGKQKRTKILDHFSKPLQRTRHLRQKYTQGRCRSQEPLLCWKEETPLVVDQI